MARLCLDCGVETVDGALRVKIDQMCGGAGLTCGTAGLTYTVPVLHRTLSDTVDVQVNVLTGGQTGAALDSDVFVTTKDTGSTLDVWRVLGNGTVEILCDGVYLVAYNGGCIKRVSADRVDGLQARIFLNAGILASAEIHDFHLDVSVDLSTDDDGPELNCTAGPLELAAGDVLDYKTIAWVEPDLSGVDFPASVNRLWLGLLGRSAA